MPPTPMETAYTAYADLWGHYRALIAVLASHVGANAERFETDVEAWFAGHHERLVDEARTRLATMMGQLPPPPV